MTAANYFNEIIADYHTLILDNMYNLDLGPTTFHLITGSILALAALVEGVKIITRQDYDTAANWIWLVFFSSIAAACIGLSDYTEVLPNFSKSYCGEKSSFSKKSTLSVDIFNAVKCTAEGLVDKISQNDITQQRLKFLESKREHTFQTLALSQEICNKPNLNKVEIGTISESNLTQKQCYNFVAQATQQLTTDKIKLLISEQQHSKSLFEIIGTSMSRIFTSSLFSFTNVLTLILQPIVTFLSSLISVIILLGSTVLSILLLILFQFIVAFLPIRELRPKIWSAYKNVLVFACLPLTLKILEKIINVLNISTAQLTLEHAVEPEFAIYGLLIILAVQIIYIALLINSIKFTQGILNLSFDTVSDFGGVANKALQTAFLAIPGVAAAKQVVRNPAKSVSQMLHPKSPTPSAQSLNNPPSTKQQSYPKKQYNYQGPRGIDHFPKNNPPSAKLSQKQIDGLNSSDPILTPEEKQRKYLQERRKKSKLPK
jgi:hypothetical protein